MTFIAMTQAELCPESGYCFQILWSKRENVRIHLERSKSPSVYNHKQKVEKAESKFSCNNPCHFNREIDHLSE